MYDDGYKRSELWLSDGFDFIQKNKISKPFYWINENFNFTLRVDSKICVILFPVTNISFARQMHLQNGKRKDFQLSLKLNSY